MKPCLIKSLKKQKELWLEAQRFLNSDPSGFGQRFFDFYDPLSEIDRAIKLLEEHETTNI